MNICHHMLTPSTQLQNGSFQVVERTRTSSKCQKMKNARAKRAKILFFIVKYANLWGFLLPSSSWLLKLPIHFNLSKMMMQITNAFSLLTFHRRLHVNFESNSWWKGHKNPRLALASWAAVKFIRRHLLWRRLTQSRMGTNGRSLHHGSISWPKPGLLIC